jgi:hypothetical protein
MKDSRDKFAGELLDAALDSQMHGTFDSDTEMPPQDASDASAAGTIRSAQPSAAAKIGSGCLRSFFKVPERRKPESERTMHSAGAGSGIGSGAKGSGDVAVAGV